MAEFVAIKDGGKTNEEGAFRILAKAFNQEAVLGDTDWQVVENNPTPDASIDLTLGDGIIQKDGYIFHGWSTAKIDITIGANSSGNDRIDAIVAYVDLSVTSDPSNNNPGALKFKNVQGTPAGSPVAPTDGEIQTSVGASNPFFRLAEIAVANGFTAINNANITDKRTWLAFTSADQSLQYDSATSTWKLTDKLDIDTSITTPIVNVDTISEKTAANGVLIDGLLIKDSVLLRHSEVDSNFVASGGVWSADDLDVDLDASMTAVVVYINGKRVTASAVVARTFTVSKDTYVDINIAGTIVYTEVANAAAAPALAANSTRLAKVVTDSDSTTEVVDLRIIPYQSAWRTWVPILENLTKGNGTIIAKYTQIGKTVHFYFRFLLGSSSTLGSNPTFTVPVALNSDWATGTELVLGTVAYLEAGVSVNYGNIHRSGSDQVFSFRAFSDDGTNEKGIALTSTVPFSWAAGDAINVVGTYEAE